MVSKFDSIYVIYKSWRRLLIRCSLVNEVLLEAKILIIIVLLSSEVYTFSENWIVVVMLSITIVTGVFRSKDMVHNYDCIFSHIEK